MDTAPRPESTAPVAEMSLTRLATAVFSVIALMLAMAALIVSADHGGDARTTPCTP